MDDILTAAKELANRISASPLSAAYLDAKAVIDKNPDYPAMLAEYRRYLVMIDGDAPDDNSLARKRQAAAVYRELTANEDIRGFLDSERRLVELVCQALDTIAAACPAEPVIPMTETAL